MVRGFGCDTGWCLISIGARPRMPPIQIYWHFDTCTFISNVLMGIQNSVDVLATEVGCYPIAWLYF